MSTQEERSARLPDCHRVPRSSAIWCARRSQTSQQPQANTVVDVQSKTPNKCGRAWDSVTLSEVLTPSSTPHSCNIVQTDWNRWNQPVVRACPCATPAPPKRSADGIIEPTVKGMLQSRPELVECRRPHLRGGACDRELRNGIA